MRHYSIYSLRVVYLYELLLLNHGFENTGIVGTINSSGNATKVTLFDARRSHYSSKSQLSGVTHCTAGITIMYQGIFLNSSCQCCYRPSTAINNCVLDDSHDSSDFCSQMIRLASQ